MGDGGSLEVEGTTEALWFPVGPVRSKSNWRVGDWDAWTRETAFSSTVAWVARAARPDGWPAPDPTVRMAARPRFVAFLWARTCLDAGNLSKSLLDACQGIVYADDAQVRHVGQLVERAARDRCGLCAFAVIPDGADADTVLVLADRLARAALTAARADGMTVG